MIDINILGTCVLRDIFNYNKNTEFCVKKFVQDISPYAIGGEENLIKDDVKFNINFENLNLANFIKRNLKLDLTSKTIEFISSENSDYLFIDLACCRYDLYFFPDKNSYTTKTLNNYEKLNITDCLEKYKEINTDQLSEQTIYRLLDNYIDIILKLYNIEKIILFDIKAIPYTLLKNGKEIKLSKLDLSDKYNRRIEKAYNYVKQKLHGCHIIEFPNGVVADEQHIWGPGVLHYVKEYYEYAYNAIKIVFSKLPLDVEKQALSSLKAYYENLIYSKYNDIWIDTLKKYNEQTDLSKRLTKYVEYFTDLLLNEEKLKKVVNYFTENEIKNCAFYGATYVGKFLIDYLKKNLPELTIDYLVEDNIKDYNGVPYIKRSAKEFPPTDVIVVSDINNRDKVVKKLTDMGVKAKITDVYKILE